MTQMPICDVVLNVNEDREGSGSPGRPARAMKQTYYVFNKTRESFLGLNIRCAGNPLSRLRGLLGRLSMGSGEGLWLVPSRGIHTIGMLFPIDVIYLDSNFQVIQMVEHLRPFRISPICLSSSSLLELPTHSIYASNTKVGDQIMICKPLEMEEYLASSDLAAEGAEMGWEAADVGERDYRSSVRSLPGPDNSLLKKNMSTERHLRTRWGQR